MHHLFSIVVISLAAVAVSPTLAAQLATDESEQVAASIVYVAESAEEWTGVALPASEVVFDPAVLVDGRRRGRHPETVVTAVRDRLDARVAHLDEVRRCLVTEDRAERIASCRLEGARAVVAAGMPVEESDQRRRVPIEVVYQVDRDTRQPVHHTLVDVVLVETADGWQVKEVRTQATT